MRSYGTTEELLDFARKNFKSNNVRVELALEKIKDKYIPGYPPKLVKSKKILGSHFLAYNAPHMEGPWHGGSFDASKGLRSKGVRNPLDMTTVLKSMSSTNGFGYAAHPYSGDIGWSKDYFHQAIGFGPYNKGGEGSIILQKSGIDFVFKGSQVWNGKKNQISKKHLNGGSLEVSDVENLDPFTPRSNGQVFVDNPNHDNRVNKAFWSYLKQVKKGLTFIFKEKPNHRFIRKVYMSAGTDAHGDFNYEISQESTAEAEISEIFFVDANIVTVTNNAFGRVRTYTPPCVRIVVASNLNF